MQQLIAHDWPGNIRELKNILERAVIMSDDTVLRLPEGFRTESTDTSLAFQASWPSLDDFQRQYILKVLPKTKGQIEGPDGAAKILGVKPSTLRSRLQKLDIRWKRPG
jgi:formate hydrogenlyase transcriptional activator